MPDAARYETIIGLEIHVQLQTRTKLFCGCANEFGGAANMRTCPVCLGLPGALPVLNASAVDYAVRAALALGCEINPRSRFARKNYFYPDLPKGYQISQFDQPLAGAGTFAFDHDGTRREVRLERLHLEEDAGKSIHDGMPRSATDTYLDLNRCGVPLIEIVTEPDMRSPEEADAFLAALRNTLLYVGVTDANMDEGSLRCDANISLRLPGQETLNPKTELKNLNSFRFLRHALRYEIERQSELLDAGEPLPQGTRLFDEQAGVTRPMRAKEEAHDYRYFPEPDLVPVQLDEAEVAACAGRIPELPLARADRLVREHGLAPADAAHLVEERPRAEYFEALVGAGVPAGDANNWLRNDVARWLNDHGAHIVDFPVAPAAAAELLAALREGVIPAAVAGRVLDLMAETGHAAADIIAREGLEQISADDDIAPVVDGILTEHPDEVAAFRGGREQVFGFLMGQVMRATQGKASPDTVRRLLRERLGE
ncbi:MAG: Asp-tRNA(Asn)/Glu-tRNA(Gln) amidotransferase subunit GatB [Acidobacteriota bacterium]|jgi:aspartyl-tRNA(Asn)/glutamyl-tRNA(Gln) amidotransferase subunit B